MIRILAGINFALALIHIGLFVINPTPHLFNF